MAAQGRQGIGVDAHGGAVIDPTRNVLDKVEDAVSRIDDMRDMSERLTDEKIKRLESAVIHQHDIAALRADYEVRLAVAEAKRIDAIRAVDVNAVAVASQRSSDQATVLASQVQQSAEALRTLVATTASAASASQQQVANTFNERLTRLEQAQYKGEGKGTGANQLWGYITAGVGLLLGLFALSKLLPN